MSDDAGLRTVEWTTELYLIWPTKRCPVCNFRLLIGEKIDMHPNGGVSHFRCRIGGMAAVEATEEIFDKVMRAAERACKRKTRDEAGGVNGLPDDVTLA